jgi:hypothetical protein
MFRSVRRVKRMVFRSFPTNRAKNGKTGFRSAATVAIVPMTKAPPRKLQHTEAGVILGHAEPTIERNDCGTIVPLKVWRANQQHDAPNFEHFAGYINLQDSGMASGQFEGSGDFRWNRALRDSTVFLTLRESCVWALPAFAAAEAEIVATHLGERTNFSRARVSATYIM